MSLVFLFWFIFIEYEDSWKVKLFILVLELEKNNYNCWMLCYWMLREGVFFLIKFNKEVMLIDI